ncbi:MAG: AmmeMemoRadiSam system protein B [Thermogutta sp.]
MNARSSDRIRPPAVAGSFYPAQPDRLKLMIGEFLDAASLICNSQQVIRAVIVPHAGYRYSGPIAAVAYKQLSGRNYDTVILLGPSHFAHFEGGAIPDVDGFATPLGEVAISNKAKILAQKAPYLIDPPAVIQAPRGWATTRTTSATPHTFEHSLEVQLPFLQQVLNEFEILPIVFGDVNIEAAAEALATVLDERTLLVVSSDLSHYQPYRRACDADRRTLEAICEFDIDYLEGLRYEPELSPCGSTGILVLLRLARRLNWQPILLDYRNSGDTSGDRSAVVGYAAVAFCETAKPSAEIETRSGEAEVSADGPHLAEAPNQPAQPADLPHLNREEKQFLLDLAWKTLQRFVRDRRLPELDPQTVPPRLRDPWACFVTLRRRGALRGCIGTLTAEQPLYRAVMENARNAARDPRFPPLEDSELAELTVEISVLSEAQPLAFQSPEELLQKLRPGIHGVILQWRGARATFLPQVWEDLSNPVDFLDRLCHKAGLPPETWRRPETRILTYQVEKFGDPGR